MLHLSREWANLWGRREGRVDQGAEAVQLPRPTLSAEACGLQLSSGGPRFTETVHVDVGIRTGFVSQVRAAASSN